MKSVGGMLLLAAAVRPLSRRTRRGVRVSHGSQLAIGPSHRICISALQDGPKAARDSYFVVGPGLKREVYPGGRHRHRFCGRHARGAVDTHRTTALCTLLLILAVVNDLRSAVMASSAPTAVPGPAAFALIRAGRYRQTLPSRVFINRCASPWADPVTGNCPGLAPTIISKLIGASVTL
jgi:hypothetical protein